MNESSWIILSAQPSRMKLSFFQTNEIELRCDGTKLQLTDRVFMPYDCHASERDGSKTRVHQVEPLHIMDTANSTNILSASFTLFFRRLLMNLSTCTCHDDGSKQITRYNYESSALVYIFQRSTTTRFNFVEESQKHVYIQKYVFFTRPLVSSSVRSLYLSRRYYDA